MKLQIGNDSKSDKVPPLEVARGLLSFHVIDVIDVGFEVQRTIVKHLFWPEVNFHHDPACPFSSQYSKIITRGQ